MTHPGVLLGLLLLTRILYAFIYPLNLSGDETYYWDWGRQLDWGYFSKPPLIAWAAHLLQNLNWDSPLGMRLFTALIGCGALALCYGLARQLYGQRPALWAAALLALSPGNAALALAFTPDTPLLLFWCGALWAFWRWQQGGGIAPATALVICLGLGLLSKQTQLAFYPLALLFLLSSPNRRGLLLQPGTWLIAILSLCFLLPVMGWNAQNAWITLAHSGQHFEPTGSDMAQIAQNLGALFGAQILLLGPLTWALLVLVIGLSLWRFRGLPPADRLLILMGPLPLLLGAILALRQEVQANWLLPFYPAAVMLMTGWALGPDPLTRLRPWLRPALVSGGLFMLITYCLPYMPLQQGLADKQIDPLHGLRGWRQGTAQVQRIREQTPDWQHLPLVLQGHRHFASELAYYLPDQPRVYRWPWVAGRIESQYEIWGLPAAQQGTDFLLVCASDKRPARLSPSLRKAFAAVEALGELEQTIGVKRKRRFRLYLGREWRGISPQHDP